MAINPILEEFPEASRRALKFYVPKITPVAPAVRLMEDSQPSVCIFEIYKKYCDKKNIDSDGPVIKFYEKLVAVSGRFLGAFSFVRFFDRLIDWLIVDRLIVFDWWIYDWLIDWLIDWLSELVGLVVRFIPCKVLSHYRMVIEIKARPRPTRVPRTVARHRPLPRFCATV